MGIMAADGGVAALTEAAALLNIDDDTGGGNDGTVAALPPLLAAPLSAADERVLAENAQATLTLPNGATIDVRRLLEPCRWLTDEPVNAFLSLVQERCRGRVLILPTHFMQLLTNDGTGYDYDRVRNITSMKRKQLLKRCGVSSGVFGGELQAVLIPVHVAKIHWWLAVVDLRSCEVLCLDSARGGASAWDPSMGANALASIVRWLEDERKDKGGAEGGKAAAWVQVLAPAHAPQRDPNRAGDCGVFCSAAADWWTSGAAGAWGYGSGDMPSFRRKMAALLLLRHQAGGDDNDDRGKK